MGPGMVIDPDVLVARDRRAARARLPRATTRWLRISEQAHLIMPYHRAIDHARERLRGAGSIGTTGRGIGPAYEDKMARTGIRVGDLFDEDGFRDALERNLREKNELPRRRSSASSRSRSTTSTALRARWRERLRPTSTDTGVEVRAAPSPPASASCSRARRA